MILRKACLFVALLFLTSGLSGAILQSEGDSPLATVEIHSDYVVYSGEEIGLDNVTWLMKANILVYGTLYLNNSDFVWDPLSDGGLRIQVYSSGVLKMKDCNMTANDTTTQQTNPGGFFWQVSWGIHYKFLFEGSGWVKDFDLSYMWGGMASSVGDLNGGIQMMNSDILLDNVNIFNGQGTGLSVSPQNPDSTYTTSGSSPTIRNTVVSNSSGMGLWVVGVLSNPQFYDSDFIGNRFRGAYHFISASGNYSDCTFSNNGGSGFFYRPYGSNYGTPTINFWNTSFTNNVESGFQSSTGGGVVNFYDCDFSRNNNSGLIQNEFSATDGTNIVTAERSTFKDNLHHGISSTIGIPTITIKNSEIAFNKMSGIKILDDDSGSSLFDNNKIYNNMEYGAVFDNTGPSHTLTNNQVYSNVMANIFLVNGSSPSISGNTLNTSTAGVMIIGSNPIVTGNDIMDHNTGIIIDDGSMPIIGNNVYTSNFVGLDLFVDGVDISGENFTSNTNYGLRLNDVSKLKVENCIFTSNSEGIRIDGGDDVELRSIGTSSSLVAGIMGVGETNFTIEASISGSPSVIDSISLNEGSRAYSFSVNIPSSTVTILDSDSEFWQYWWMSLIVADNVTFLPVDTADVVIIGATEDEISTGMTVADGSWTELVPSYVKIGQNTFNYDPVNITVTKNGYVPFWGGGENFNADLNKTILLSENRLPEFPIEPIHSPDETHQKRPMIGWSEAWDWNSDVINYNVNVYMGELYGEDHIVQDIVVREPMYTFDKNLRYNRVYWVEIKSFDPWGLSDTFIFSFETINSPPSTPEVGFLFTPVSTRDDITVVILNQSTDIDTDPVDQLSYLVEWYAYREESWVLVASGINMTVLPSEKTREGEDMKAIVKPYDGIEYGLSAEIFIKVVNFAPSAVMEYVDLGIDEDQEGIDLIDLKTLFMDRDGDDLSFRVKSERHVVAVIDQVTNNVTFVPDPNWIGVDQVIIEAFDTKQHDEEWPTVTINITVNAVNDAPTISFVNEEPISQGEIFLIQGIQGSNEVITIGASDPDEIYGDEYTFSTNFLEVVGEGIIPDGDFVFETNTGRMSIFLSNALVGEYVFNITATDESNDESTIQVRLLVDNTNDPPESAEIKSPLIGESVDQGIGLSVDFTAADSDDPDLHIPKSNERLSYDWDFGDGSEILTNAGTSVSHQFLVTGNYTIKLMVKDNFGEVVEHEVTIFVEVEQNLPPVGGGVSGGQSGTTLFLIIVLIVIGIILLAIILFFAMRKDPLQDTAEAEEQAHEALVAKQQEDALIAQDRLQALLSGAAVQGVSGPALPAAEGSEMEALPAAPTEEVPGMEPPMEPAAYPEQPMGYDQPPVQEPPVEQPMYDQAPPVPEPVPEPAPMEAAAPPVPEPVPTEPPVAPEPAPMQAAPAGTVPMPVAPEAQSNLPPPEEPQQ